MYNWNTLCCYSYNKLALNGTVPAEVITEDSGLAGHLHLSHNNTVIYNVPLKSNSLKPLSSKLLSSSMSSSILSSSVKLARQLLEENNSAPVDENKKEDSSVHHDKDTVGTTSHDEVKDTKVVIDHEVQQNEKIGETEKSVPVVHVNRFRPIIFKLLLQEQVTAVSMGTLHTAFVTGKSWSVVHPCIVI